MLKVTKKSTRVLQKHRAAGFSLRGFAWGRPRTAEAAPGPRISAANRRPARLRSDR
jgi:hypothetical protein